MSNTCTAYSSLGELVFNAETGVVDRAASEYYPGTGDDSLREIVRLDVKEFCEFWGIEPQDCDFLDIGCWYQDGRYEPALKDWRLDVVIPMLREEVDPDVLAAAGPLQPRELLKLARGGRAVGALPK